MNILWVGLFLFSFCGANASLTSKIKGWFVWNNSLPYFYSDNGQKCYYIDKKEGRFVITRKKELCSDCKDGKREVIKVSLNCSNPEIKRNDYFCLTKNLATGKTEFKSYVPDKNGFLWFRPKDLDGRPILSSYEKDKKQLLEDTFKEIDLKSYEIQRQEEPVEVEV